MKTHPFVLPLSLLAAFGLLGAGAGLESDRTVSPDEIKELKKSISSLEKKLHDLEDRLKTVEKKKETIILPPQTQPPRVNSPFYFRPDGKMRPQLKTPSRPKIWGQGECNGWPYYLMPVGETPGPNP